MPGARPGASCSVEVWRSRADLEAHLAGDHVQTASTGLPDMLAGAPQLVGFEGGERVDLPL